MPESPLASSSLSRQTNTLRDDNSPRRRRYLPNKMYSRACSAVAIKHLKLCPEIAGDGTRRYATSAQCSPAWRDRTSALFERPGTRFAGSGRDGENDHPVGHSPRSRAKRVCGGGFRSNIPSRHASLREAGVPADTLARISGYEADSSTGSRGSLEQAPLHGRRIEPRQHKADA